MVITYIVVALVFASLTVLFSVLGYNAIEPPSEWSQLTDEEQDQIRENVQFG